MLPPTLTPDVDYAAIAGEPRTTPSRPPEEARRRAAGRGALALLADAADSTTATAAGGLPLR